MGVPFAHGTQKRRIMAALWWLLPSQFGDNPGQVSFAKHARPFQRLACLHSVLKNRSCQGLSPNPCRNWGYPKNSNHYAIWLVWVFVHTFWTVKRRTNISKTDVSHHRWLGRCVCIHGRVTCRLSGQANTPPPSGGFFTALATNGLAINLEKFVFAVPSLEILGHTISAAGAAPTAGHVAEIELCPPPHNIK